MAVRPTGYKLFPGSANEPLARRIADYLHQPLSQRTCKRFHDGETYVSSEENMRGADVFVLQPTSPPVNDNLMELLISIDALKRASAERITAVVPYYGYARQEKKDRPREPISARLVADMIQAAGAHRLVTIDLHAGAIQGFFDIPIDHLSTLNMIAGYLRRQSDLTDSIVVAPDTGRAKAAEKLAEELGLSMAVIHKHRPQQEQAEVTHIAGDLTDLRPIVFEDIVSTGGTLSQAIDAMLAAGCKPDIRIAVTHALLTDNAIRRLDRPEVTELIVTDTVPLPQPLLPGKATVLTVARLLGEAIRRIHFGESVSALFERRLDEGQGELNF